MSWFNPQNPGIDGIDELTAAEEEFLTSLAGLSYSEGDLLHYNSTSGLLDNTNTLFWDNTNKRLGVGTKTVSARITLDGSATANGIHFNNGAVELFDAATGNFQIKSGTGSFQWSFNPTFMGDSAGAGGALMNVDSSLTSVTIAPYRSDTNTGLGADGSDKLALIAGGNNVLTVDGVNSRVGILNDSPATEFDVTGDITMSGDLYRGSNYSLVYTTGESLFVGTASSHSGLNQLGATNNIASGRLALNAITIGDRNSIYGALAGVTITSSADNAFFGNLSGNLAIGSRNSLFGTASGRRVTGSDNVFLGYNSGNRQTSVSDILIIDNQDRGSSATELTDSLIVGTFNATKANQTLQFNAATKVSSTAAGNSFIVDVSGTEVLQVDANGNLYNNGNATLINIATNSTYINTNATQSASTGAQNTVIGHSAGNAITSAANNTLIGHLAGRVLAVGDDNVVIGRTAGYDLLGSENTIVGRSAGRFTAGGDNGNVYLGHFAGYYQTSSNNLIIDNQNRTDLATEIASSLIYGNFNATAANQTLRFNAKVGVGKTPTEELDIVGNIKATGYISGKKSGVFAYLSSAANTTITTAGTYYPIVGTFTNSPIEDFTGVATPAIRYDGATTQYFEIDYHASLSGDSAGITAHIGIKKNGVLCTGGVMGTFLKFVGEEQPISGTCVIELATNDTIQLVCTSDGNGDVLTFEHFTTTITEFFD